MCRLFCTGLKEGIDMARKTNKEAAMGLLTTLIRLGVIEKRPLDFPMFFVWSKNVKRYSEKYGIKDEVEPA